MARASVQARAHSDLDLLLVMPQAPDRRAAAAEVMRELRDLTVGNVIIVTTPEQLAERGQVDGLIYKAAIEQGRVTYERR